MRELVWALFLCLLLGATVSSEETVVSGRLFAFGKVKHDSKASHLGSNEKAHFLESLKFRTVGAGPEAGVAISSTDGAPAFKFTDISTNGELLDPQISEMHWCQICRTQQRTVAVTCFGEAYAWDGPNMMKFPEDRPILTTSPVPLWVHQSNKIIQISCARSHVIFLTDDRKVMVLGDTSNGRLGDSILTPGRVSSTDFPVELPVLSPGNFVGNDTVCFVHAGGRSSFAVTERGDMYVWGANELGQLGLNTTSTGQYFPVKAETEMRVCEVSAADTFVMGIDHDGEVWGWGSSSFTPVKHGNDLHTRSVLESLSPQSAMMVAVGEFHASILLTNSSVLSFGYNRFGQLGVELDKNNEYQGIWTTTPQLVNYLEGRHIGSIFASGNFTLALEGVKTPSNCPCARGGRTSRSFGIPGSIPVPRPPEPVTVGQPQYKPASYFGPVAPNKMKPRIASKRPIEGEVVETEPWNLTRPHPLHDTHLAANNADEKKPELAPAVARFFFYSHDSNEAKTWREGIKAGAHQDVFGKHVSADGSFYGDDEDAKLLRIPTEATHSAMPAPRDPLSGPPSHEIKDYMGESEQPPLDVFSLSLQDVKRSTKVEVDDMTIAKNDVVTQNTDSSSPPPDFSFPGEVEDLEYGQHEANLGALSSSARLALLAQRQ